MHPIEFKAIANPLELNTGPPLPRPSTKSVDEKHGPAKPGRTLRNPRAGNQDEPERLGSTGALPVITILPKCLRSSSALWASMPCSRG